MHFWFLPNIYEKYEETNSNFNLQNTGNILREQN